jgi:O-antigen/teichoic acid export membrane protein
LISIPLIAWFYPQEAVATNALVLTLITLCSMACSLGLDAYYVREFHEKEPNQLFWFSLGIATLFTVICLSVLSIVLPTTLSEWLYGEKNAVLDGLIFVAIFASNYNRFPLSVLRMHEQSLKFSLGQALQKFFFVSLLIICAIGGVTQDSTLVLITLTAYIVVAFYVTWKAKPYISTFGKLDWTWLQTKEALSYGIPLIIGGISAWAMTSTDRFMLDILSSREELAVYALAFNFATLASIVQVVFINVWSPHVFKEVKNGNEKDLYQSVLDKMTAVVVAMISLFGVASWVFAWVLPDSYNQVGYIVVLCAMVPLVATLSSLTTVAIQVSKKTYLITLCTLAALVFNIVINIPLITKLGATGAALASVISQFFYYVLNSSLAKHQGAKLDLAKSYWLVCLCSIFATAHALSPYSVLLSSVLWLLPLALVAIQYKRDIVLLLEALLKRVRPGKVQP